MCKSKTVSQNVKYLCKMIIICMGVCGCGKTTTGKLLSQKLGWTFADADDYHPDSNKDKMTNSIPLTDEDRWPWLGALHNAIESWQQLNQSAVVTCSALKKIYRQVLLHGTSVIDIPANHGIQRNDDEESSANHISDTQRESTNQMSNLNQTDNALLASSTHKRLVFVYLKGSQELLTRRLQNRSGHFMSPELLQSQLEILEAPGPDEDHLDISIDQSQDDIVQSIIASISLQSFL